MGIWMDENVSSDWSSLRTEAMALLQEESKLEEIVRLVGIDALSVELTCVSVVVVVAVLADADASDETEPMVPVPVTFTKSALMNPLVFASTNT